MTGEELAEITASVLQNQRTNAYDLPTVARHRAILLGEVDRLHAEIRQWIRSAEALGQVGAAKMMRAAIEEKEDGA